MTADEQFQELAYFVPKLRELTRRLSRLADESPTRFTPIFSRAFPSLDEALGELEDGLRELREAARPEEENAEWVAFLSEHPELERSNEAASLTFTDEELLAALEATHAERTRARERQGRRPRKLSVVGSSQVAETMAAWRACRDPEAGPATHGDISRIGQRLGALARQGRVERVLRAGDTTRWQPIAAARGSES
jgi:hypothetical protein